MAKSTPPAPAPKPKPAPAKTLPATIDLRQPLIVLRSHILVAAALALVICTLVAWQQMQRPKQYAALATLVVERTDRTALSMLSENDLAYDMAIGTKLEQLHSRELHDRVAASFTEEERKLLLPTEGSGPQAVNADRYLQGLVRGAITIERRLNTALIDVTAVHGDPKLAALLANRFAEQVNGFLFDRGHAASEASLSFLRAQAEEVRKKAEDAERSLQEYRQKYNLVSLEANQNIIVDNLKSLNGSATAARVARVGIEARMEQADAVMKRSHDAEQLAAITRYEGLVDIARRLDELRSKRAVMAERYGRRHQLMQENERAIQALEKLRDEQAETAMVSLRDQRDKALSEERQLADQLAAAEKEALKLDQLGVEYNILRRAVDSHKASYSQILTRLNDAAITAQLRGVDIKVSDLAYPPLLPFSPNPRKTLALSIGLALIILLGYPFCAELFFGRIRSASDIEYHLGSEVIGEIGSVRRIDEKDRAVLVKSESDESSAEQFRGLFSQLSLTTRIDPPKTVLITSTLPGEGKSFIAANLAQCFVAHGRRTLLIDADLRRPAQHRQFGLDNRTGIIRWLNEGGALEGDWIKNEKLGLVEVHPGLFLLRAGGNSRKASELMDGERLPALLAALQQKFDIVILDTPPAGIFPDAVSFAKVAQEAIFICRFNVASRQAVRDVLQRLKQTGMDLTGVVLNAMPSGFTGSYYYKGYSYYQAKSYAKDYKQVKS